MKVRYQVFKSQYRSWDDLFKEASDFASKIGPERLINISHACDHHMGTVTVWYWGK